jgi:myo-inositol-1(or 4)-monophosphatase
MRQVLMLYGKQQRAREHFLNDKKIKCNNPVNLNMALIATGFSYDLELRKEQGARIQRLIPQIRDFRRNGAAAVDLCYCCNGRS